MLYIVLSLCLTTSLSAGILNNTLRFFAQWDAYCKQNRQELINAYTNPQDTFNVNEDFSNPPATSTDNELAGKLPPEIEDFFDEELKADKYTELGAKRCKGCLLYGPPGTGKTLIARTIAKRLNAFFISASGSEFVELFVGMGPKRVRELFAQARQALAKGAERAIIFIDEIDAIGGERGFEQNSEYRNTLNELLNQMDGFSKNEKITVIAATNHIENLDKALLRPGRFDRLIKIGLPDYENRIAIMNHYLQKIKFSGTQETVIIIADATSGYSAAELESLVNEAAILAVRTDADWVTDEHLLESFEHLKIQHKKRTFNS